MICLTRFWILVALFIIAYLISKHVILMKKAIDEYAMPFMMFLFSLAIIAVVTNDPLTSLGIDIPLQMQWIGSLFTVLFGSWQFYLRPMKEQVNRMDRELGELKSKVDTIIVDLQMVKERLMQLT